MATGNVITNNISILKSILTMVFRIKDISIVNIEHNQNLQNLN